MTNTKKRDLDIESRQHTRYPIEATASIVYGDKKFQTSTVNISYQGCALKRPVPLDMEQKNFILHLVYMTSDGEPYKAKEKAKFTTEDRRHIEFIEGRDVMIFLEKITG